MNLLEKEIEDVIWALHQDHYDQLDPKGLYLHEYGIRQLKIGDYGVADMVFFDKEPIGNDFWHLHIQIVELKRDEVNANTLMQAIRYETGLKKMLKPHFRDYVEVFFKYILIGKNINRGDFLYTPDCFDKVSLFTYKLDALTGIEFEEYCGYSLVSPNFGETNKDLINFLKIQEDEK